MLSDFQRMHRRKFRNSRRAKVEKRIWCKETLRKKPSLQNLKWSRVIKTKYACLDEADPNVRGMPHPAKTYWGVRSDLAYDLKHRSHLRRLTDEQAGNEDDEPSIIKSAEHSGQRGPSGSLYQRTRSRNLKRYNQIHSKIKPESAHTLTLNNEVVLRKSGVATKPKAKKTRAYLAPLNPPEVKERATKKADAEKQQRKRTGRRFEKSE